MNTVNLVCIECPMGCAITVQTQDGQVVSVQGNTCPRGKAYAESEVVCPMRVVTSTVRAQNGDMVSVKTQQPVKKSEIFAVMQKINGAHPALPVHIGDVLLPDVSDGVALVATANAD